MSDSKLMLVPVHVVPMWGPKHDDSADCWCKPKVERETDAADLIIHNAPTQ